MLEHYRFARLAVLLTVGLLLTTLPGPVAAQDGGPAYVFFRFHTVKPDQVSTYENIIKERAEAEQAAGRAFLRVFQRIRGPQFTYLILHLDAAAGQTEEPDVDGSPTWGLRLNQTLASSTLLTVQMPQELSANTDNWLTPGALMFARIRTVAPGRDEEYYDWQANQLVPALRDAGVSLRGGRVFLGGNNRTFVRITSNENWAAVNAPNPAIQSEEFQRMLAAGEAMIVASENMMYRYRADLSFPND